MNLFTNTQVAEIIGWDDADMELDDSFTRIAVGDSAGNFLLSNADEIQVCAGTWVRLNADLWYFQNDPEWDA
jgi:hypothetical protein